MTDQNAAASVTTRPATGAQRCMHQGCGQPATVEIYGKARGQLQHLLCQPHANGMLIAAARYRERQAKRRTAP